jgi:hypothetical protein
MLIGNYNASYIGKSMCGFKKGNEYCIDINKDIYGYTVSGVLNLTDEVANDGCVNYASENSIKRNWIINEDLTKLGSD